ncbi:hypothetical protein [Candidatus Chloroploca asiatica]|uniref:Uncharacterized protein n=1 Tax=Candidatus Chloroploca asiatica TaxID=1506545 RepID=A0A2H3L9F0_9CHLR|nr:hypothetical protein [Candidatus Chloroploca asiatica]PDV99961.1 hypothetical protein A9Q02_11035 [Candidatus Chloroploca asiatica]
MRLGVKTAWPWKPSTSKRALLWMRAVPGREIAASLVPLLSAALLWRTVVVTERTVGQRNAV